MVPPSFCQVYVGNGKTILLPTVQLFIPKKQKYIRFFVFISKKMRTFVNY